MKISNYLIAASLGLTITPLASAALLSEISGLREISLGFDSICAFDVTPAGDVYLLGLMNDNRKVIRYTVVKNDFKTLYSGEVKSRYDSNILCDSRDSIVPGDRDDFYFRAEWSYDPEFLESRNYGSIHHVKFKEQQSETLFSHKDISINDLFLNKNNKRLYVTVAPTWSPDQHHTTVMAYDITTGARQWHEHYPYASKGSIASHDRSKLYLLGEDKAQLIDLVDNTIIYESESLIGANLATTDDEGNVYAGNLNGKQGRVFMAKIQPFSSSPAPLQWLIPYSEDLTQDVFSRAVVAPDNSLFISSATTVNGAGIWQLDPNTGERISFIFPPAMDIDTRPEFIASAVFDNQTGIGYSYSSFKPRKDSRDNAHDIWRFSPDGRTSEKLFTLSDGIYVPRGFGLANNHLLVALKDTLYIYNLNQEENELGYEGVKNNGPETFTRHDADQGITIQYQAPPESAGRHDYYLFSLNEDRTKFGSYLKVKAGSKGEEKVKIYKTWHPQGGKFTLGLTDDVTRPGTVQAIGESVAVTVIP